MNNDGRYKLTAKQLRFVAAYLETENGTLAAKVAGYKGDDNQLAVQASVNLRNPKIQQLIEDSLFVPALKAVHGALGATKTRYFLSKDGVVISSTPEPDHQVRLQAADRVFKARSKARGHGPEQLHDKADDDAPTEMEEFDPKDQELMRHASAISAVEAELEALADAIEPPPINASCTPSEQAAGDGGEHIAQDPVGQGPVGQTDASDDGGGAAQAIRDQREQPRNVPEVAPESGHGAEVANNPSEP
jgi:Terminase small subunit